MRYTISIIGFICITNVSWSQNCNAFLYEGDTLQYEACIIAEEANGLYQFSKDYQQIYDRSIEKCPYFSIAYNAKSVAYLKSGDFIIWKRLIDKAVDLNPTEYLGTRASCRFKFIGDYQGAIDDIDRLDSLISYNVGFTSNGNYQLNIVKGLCYKSLGQKHKAIEVIKHQISLDDHLVGMYDYLHLGVLYLEVDDPKMAIKNLQLQVEENNIAECQYYLAMAYKKSKNPKDAIKHLRNAKDLYSRGVKMFDGYNQQTDKIYMEQIDQALESL